MGVDPWFGVWRDGVGSRG